MCCAVLLYEDMGCQIYNYLDAENNRIQYETTSAIEKRRESVRTNNYSGISREYKRLKESRNIKQYGYYVL